MGTSVRLVRQSTSRERRECEEEGLLSQQGQKDEELADRWTALRRPEDQVSQPGRKERARSMN